MLTTEQFDKAKQFIYRHGRLLERARFALHFENGDTSQVLSALECYQNADGGFGNGLELDIMCPASTPMCTEVALAIMADCGVGDPAVLEKCENWVLKSLTPEGSLPQPVEEIKKYPHGPWWAKPDDDRIYSIAGYLAKLGKGNADFFKAVTDNFIKRFTPFTYALKVYDYPLHIYLENSPHKEQLSVKFASYDKAFTELLKKAAWHHPLFFCHDRWYNKRIDEQTWNDQAKAAISTLQDDGGVTIDEYADLPWWRPVWTLEMLIRLKKQELI